jgi:hypothetical protein
VIEIESEAKRRLADEYDAAQERGEVEKHGGQGRDIPDGNLPPAKNSDLGISPKTIHEGCQTRDAEKKPRSRQARGRDVIEIGRRLTLAQSAKLPSPHKVVFPRELI